MAKMRLDKYLAKCGWGTRSEVKKLIRAGIVEVNGMPAKDVGEIIETSAIVTVEGQPVEYREHYYLMMNKPAGVISATQDRLHSTVLDLLPPQYRHLDLFPVGRLDRDTEGLMLLTDDGALAHCLLSPKKHVPKTYRARIGGLVGESDVSRFSQGISLEDFTTQPASLEVLQAGPESLVEVTIFEGKYHQVKRMFQAVGKEVLYLQRTAMGGLALDTGLEPGELRDLTDQELALLQESR